MDLIGIPSVVRGSTIRCRELAQVCTFPRKALRTLRSLWSFGTQRTCSSLARNQEAEG